MIFARVVPNLKRLGLITPRVRESFEKLGIIHAGIGKASFTEDAIEKNVRAFVEALLKAKPSGAKGTYVKKISVSSTMGPGLRLEPQSLTA